MSQHDDQHADSIAILHERFAAGRIGRRDLMAGLAALGAAAALSGPARAQSGGSVVLANWGGPAIDAFREAWGKDYEARTGTRVVVDGGGPSAGKIRAMVESRAVSWDLCDANAGEATYLGENGFLEPIDWTLIDAANVLPQFKSPWGVCNYVFSYVLAFNKEKLGGRTPTGWADFWNVKDFPGKRALRKNVVGMCECAMLADGVPPGEVYQRLAAPGGLERAMEKFRAIKDHVIFWDSGSQSAQLLRDGEVAMGNIWNTRAGLLHKDSGGAIDFLWNGGLLTPSIWAIPKGNPAGRDAAHRFADYSLRPESQVVLLRLLGNGPSNPNTAALIPDDLKRFDPTQPAHIASQVSFDVDWYKRFQDKARDLYIEVQSS